MLYLFSKYLYKFAPVCFITTFCVLITTGAWAQLCTGTLGNPVVNIDFGTGGTNTGYTPTNAYTYINDPCPDDGYYTITNSTSNCFSNTWHTVNNDHTGNGAFMIINASYAPGDFIRTSVKDLCPSTSYEFSSWVMNLVTVVGIEPNITFTVEDLNGNILQQYSTGNIVATILPEWKQYGFVFTTPPNNPEIVLRMTNNAPGGGGNDIALDDIVFRPCNATPVTATFDAGGQIIKLCEQIDTTLRFNASYGGGFQNPVYQWQESPDDGSTWQDIGGAQQLFYLRNNTAAGQYQYRFSVREQSIFDLPHCRVVTPEVSVRVATAPVVNAGPDQLVVKGNSLQLTGTSTGTDNTFQWLPPDFLDNNKLSNPLCSPTADITYLLEVTNAEGCIGRDAVFVKVMPQLYVPSAFTPNNDGLNDRWRIPHLIPTKETLVQVFNRLGQRVYVANAVAVNWDGTLNGTPLSGGSYVYYIRLGGGKQPGILKGVVTLIR